MLGNILATGANIFSTIYNQKKQEQINELNWQRTQDLNAIQQKREDTAHQREVADLQKAGLSPLAAVGGASAAAPMGYEAQAPQMDLSGAIGAMTNIDTIASEERRHKADLEQNATIQGANLKENIRQFDKNYGIEQERISAELQKISDQYNKDRNEYEKSKIEYYSTKLAEDNIKMFEANGIPYQMDYITNIDDYYAKLNDYLEITNRNTSTLQKISELTENGVLTNSVLKRTLENTASNDIKGRLNAALKLMGLDGLLGAGASAETLSGTKTNWLVEKYDTMDAKTKEKLWQAIINAGGTLKVKDDQGLEHTLTFEKVIMPKYIGKINYKNYR